MTTTPANVLVVDDEFSVRDSLTSWFEKDGYHVDSAEDGPAALARLHDGAYDVVLLDIKMPGMDGMEVQEQIHKIDPSISVIMITAFATVDTAVLALKRGAFDYVTKPVDPDELSMLVRRALEQRRLQDENAKLRETIAMTQDDDIVGQSPAMQRVLGMVRDVAETDATVLIRGESGTGKELVARAIHAHSARRYFPIVPVNCGALPETLLESELFGHEKGAFTGAQFRRKGKIEMAHRGTLFLDEVGTISPKMQVDLLRVLDSKELTRVGGSKTVHVDFRVICATNDDLESRVRSEAFREDLYYRINVFSILVPPLRERREDISLLARHFLERLGMQMDKRFTEISDEAMAILEQYRWPGNVRELGNAIERAVVVGKSPRIEADNLPVFRSDYGAGTVGVTLADVERSHIVRVLSQTAWNITHSAAILAIDRATLYNKIKKYDLKRPSG